MSDEADKDGPLDKILSMGRLSSEGNVYRVELEIAGGGDTGTRKEIQALVFPAGSGRFMILQKKPNGGYENIPNLAVYSEEEAPNGYIRPESAVAILRK